VCVGGATMIASHILNLAEVSRLVAGWVCTGHCIHVCGCATVLRTARGYSMQHACLSHIPNLANVGAVVCSSAFCVFVMCVCECGWVWVGWWGRGAVQMHAAYYLHVMCFKQGQPLACPFLLILLCIVHVLIGVPAALLSCGCICTIKHTVCALVRLTDSNKTPSEFVPAAALTAGACGACGIQRLPSSSQQLCGPRLQVRWPNLGSCWFGCNSINILALHVALIISSVGSGCCQIFPQVCL
jgi:hypothetical protein